MVSTVPIKYLLNFSITLKLLYFLEQIESNDESDLIECLSLSQIKLKDIKEVVFGQKVKWKIRNIKITLVAQPSGHGFGSCYFQFKLNGLRTLYLTHFNDDKNGYLRPFNVDHLLKKPFHLSLVVAKTPAETVYYGRQRYDLLATLLKRMRTQGKTNVIVFGDLPVLVEWLLIVSKIQQSGEHLKIFLPKNLSLYVQLVKMLTEYMEPGLANRVCEGDQEILPAGSVQLIHFKDFLMQRKDSASILFIYEEQLLKSNWNKILFQREYYNLLFIRDAPSSDQILKPSTVKMDTCLVEESGGLQIEEGGYSVPCPVVSVRLWVLALAKHRYKKQYFDTILEKDIMMSNEHGPAAKFEHQGKTNLAAMSITAKTDIGTVADSIHNSKKNEHSNQIQFDSANDSSFVEQGGQVLFGLNQSFYERAGASTTNAEPDNESQFGTSLTPKFFELFREEQTDLIIEKDKLNAQEQKPDRIIGEDREELKVNIEKQIQFNQELLFSDFDKSGQSLNQKIGRLEAHLEQTEPVHSPVLLGTLSADFETQKLIFSRLNSEKFLMLNSGSESSFGREDMGLGFVGQEPVTVTFANSVKLYPWKVDPELKIKMYRFDQESVICLLKVKLDRTLKEKHFLSFEDLKTNHFWLIKKNFLLGFLSFLKHSEDIDNRGIYLQKGTVVYKNKVQLVKKYGGHALLEGQIGEEYLLLRKLLYKFLKFA